MKPILRGALLGALTVGALLFLAVLVLELHDEARFHAPPGWLIAAGYGAGGAAVGGFVGGILAALFAGRGDKTGGGER